MNFKDQFFLPDNEIYLNCAGQGPLCKAASEAVEKSLGDKKNPTNLNMEYGRLRSDACRQAIAKFIDLPATNIALADSTSWGINIVARGLKLSAGDEVVLFDGQFPSNAAPWEVLAKQGVKIKKIPNVDYCADLGEFAASLNSSTKVACLEWVHWISGDRLPLREMISLCQSRGILVVVDVTQGLGAIPFSFKDYPADAICCSGYKWLTSPYGSGFFALSPAMLERLSGSHINWLCFESVLKGNISGYTVDLCKTARRFDVFSHMGYLNLDGLTASVEWLLTLNLKNTFLNSRKLNRLLAENLEPRKYRLLNKGDEERQSLISTFEIKGGTAKIQQVFSENKIFATFRDGNVRLAPHLYNNSAQIEKVITLMNNN